MTIADAKRNIINLVSQTNSVIPEKLESNLKPLDGDPDIPAWHKFEIEVWNFGEDIRQILKQYKPLRKDTYLLDLFLAICLNRNSKRGRQSFLKLFEFKHCEIYAKQIITQIDDHFVEGHVIRCLNKMQAGGFSALIRKFTTHNVTWIRNDANKYAEKHS